MGFTALRPSLRKKKALLQIQWPAQPRRAPVERPSGPARRSRPGAASLVAPYAAALRRAASTANFPAAGGRRPAGETRCVALDRFSFIWRGAACCRAQGRLLSFSVSVNETLPNFDPPGEITG
jgi:hypothetical protein